MSKKISNIQPGKEELAFDSWEELLTVLATVDTQGWIFRGQSQYEWPLLPSLGRDLNVPPGTYVGDRDIEREAIQFFRLQASEESQWRDSDEDYLDLLFKMQHYGAPTRLLDWSRSAFVALYFAYADANLKDNPAALWMLDEVHTIQLYGNSQDFLPSHTHQIDQGTKLIHNPYWFENQARLAIEIADRNKKWPLPVVPQNIDKRMLAQQAAFTFHGNLQAANSDPIKALWEAPMLKFKSDRTGFVDGGQPSPGPTSKYVRKISLPSEWRRSVLTALERMNITAASLFPGMDGIGRATKEHLLSGQRVIRSLQHATVNVGVAAKVSIVAGSPSVSIENQTS